ncbi:MAG: hypothetical protein Q7S22_00845 [Candidatus Micrarchaeota archaeon]|nr:hypothetical protein [Candidatus Micrarchaeota archaeon]
MFEVYFGNKRANKDYEQLDQKTRDRINEFCELIKNVPVPFREYDIIKIVGRENSFRVRLGRHRMIYYVDELSHKIYIIKIELRDDSTYKD